MTDTISTDPADAAPAAPSGARSRPRRRSPSDLPFRFADRALAEQLAAEREEPQWLAAERLAALAGFESLPIEPNQLYTPYVDLRSADLLAARPYVLDGPAGLGDDLAALRAPDAPGLPDGVVVETMSEWLERDPAGFRSALDGAPTLPVADKLAQLARGFWSHGRHVEIADGLALATPIVLRWPGSAPGRALITRTLITLGAGASASIVEELVPCGPVIECAEGETVPQGLFHGTTEVVLGAGASLAMASIQELGPGQVAFQHRHAAIGEAAALHWALAQLGGRLVRSRVDNRLEGDRSSVEQVEIVFAAEDQLFDLTSYTRHLGRDTTGNLLSKGVLLDRSRSFMKGLITIEKSAIGTDSFLGEFGMNLSKAARAVAIPSLEIDQPDCRRAAHSSSVGPIDPTQLFYLESRGISTDDARKFVVLGFLEPVVAAVPLDDARDRLRELLEEKWAAGLRESATAA
ncbi:MAG TPA: SufD family Fe-S cluster assembly protein [Candidatus Deferrimicrobiaceae bacterium]|nr:SufD family Fe-S cluster assembly protein [Candidatus Deferrimicrobiaceae bacterium]